AQWLVLDRNQQGKHEQHQVDGDRRRNHVFQSIVGGGDLWHLCIVNLNHAIVVLASLEFQLLEVCLQVVVRRHQCLELTLKELGLDAVVSDNFPVNLRLRIVLRQVLFLLYQRRDIKLQLREFLLVLQVRFSLIGSQLRVKRRLCSDQLQVGFYHFAGNQFPH